MGRFFVGVCFILYCAQVMMHSTAERLYFFQESHYTWENARNYCKHCFKDLATVVPADTYTMAKNVTSDSWIGLRKFFYNTSNSNGNSTDRGMPWSRWANGDPLAFQNWFPGWPKFESALPKIDCCSCSCTCPAATTPLTTSFPLTYTTPSSYFNTTVLPDFPASVTDNLTSSNSTDSSNSITSYPGATTTFTTTKKPTNTQSTTAAPTLPIESTCERRPIPIPDFLNPNKDYIDDSCVAMLSSGAWVEKNCSDLLPFICYQDRFSGFVNVTDITASTAVLTWQPGPDGISEYRLEVTGTANLTFNMSLNLTHTLNNLTAGSLYMIKVVSVQCERDIDNPQNTTFYTIPNKVVNLTVSQQTDTSITLSWNKPVGNINFYRIDYNGTQSNCTTEGKLISDLTPGNLYIFSVFSGVQDISKWSQASTTQAYTKPGKVSNLSVSDNEDVSLKLRWDPPPGNVSGYRVKVIVNTSLLNEIVVITSSTSVVDLKPGMAVTLNVTAHVNFSLEGKAFSLDGETATISTFTTPGSVSNLTLSSTFYFINSIWKKPEGSDLTFVAAIISKENNYTQTKSVKEESVTFYDLHPATNYLVTVRCYSGSYSTLLSPEVTSTIFTKLVPPENARVKYVNEKEIQVTWDPPKNAGQTTYEVKLNSRFWGHSWTDKTNATNYTFNNLKSGTTYYFEVRVIADNQRSDPANVTQSTVPNKLQVSLSMMCSSTIPLLCAHTNTENQILQELKKYFGNKLDGVYWELDKMKSENL